MANKEFQVRHGLVVNTDVLVANTDTGNVGFGVTSPAYKVDVAGAVNAASFLVAGANVLATINSVGSSGNNYAGVMANGAGTIANAAFAAANQAGVVANNANTFAAATYVKKSGDTINGPLYIVGDLTVSGNTRQIGAETLRVSDPLIYLAANNYSSDIVDIGFIANYVNTAGANVHTGLYREHENKEYYLFQEYAAEPLNNHIGAMSNNMSLAILNADIKTSNLNLGGANAIVWIKSAYDTVNAAYTSSNADYTLTNAAFTQANTDNVRLSAAYVSLNAAYVVANAAYGSANAIATSANNYAGAMANSVNSAFATADSGVRAYVNTSTTAANNYAGAMANAANAIASATYSTQSSLSTGLTSANNYAGAMANSANARADTKVSSVTGTSGRITSSGGTTPAIDLATAGPGAGSYSGGISALTIDAYGRLTAVTGSAGYVTSSGVTSITAGTGLSGGTITATGTISMPNVGPGAGSYSSGISAITLDAQGRVTAITGSAGYATTTQLSSYLPLSGGTLTGRVIQSAAGFGVGTDDTIQNRVDSGFWQTSNAQTANGWPESTASWYHLITSTHSNDTNYFSMQFAGSFFDSNALYYRATNNAGNTAWNKVWHAGNDGASSGLDADLLDGQHGSYYLPKSVNLFSGSADDISGPISFLRDGVTFDDYIIKNANNRGFFAKAGHGWHNRTESCFHVFSSGWVANFGVNTDGVVRARSDFRAPIFYDSDNTGYYMNGASNSSINNITLAGGISTTSGSSWISQKTATDVPIQETNTQATGNSYKAFVRSTNANNTFTMGRLTDSTMGFYGYYTATVANQTDYYAVMDNGGRWLVSNSVDSPLYRDLNNTAYYIDGAGTSNLNGLTVAATITGSISGNAGTATTLQTARTINGTSFNGSANITTNSWGTARTLTIGSTGKSVDGSAAVSWTAAEMGVAALSGATYTGLIIGATSSSANTSVANDSGSMSIRGSTTAPAVVSWHRAGAYAINMGLDTDNVFRIGGWSDGVNTYRLTLGTPGGTHTFNGTVSATTFSGAGTNLTGTAASLTAGAATTATNQSGGTVSATTGSFSGTITLPSGGGTNEIKAGTGDGASFTTYNVAIRSWYGIGFRDFSDATTVKAYLDCRNGNFGTSGDLLVGGGADGIQLNNATSNYITWGTAGVAAPAFTTRSAGTKLVLYPSIGASAADYALGIDNNTLWYSVSSTAQQFRWYGGTTLAATLSGAGTLQLVGPLNTINNYTPPNGAIRLTPNMHINSANGNSVILNWDNGYSGPATSTLRIGNGAGSDVYYIRQDGYSYQTNYAQNGSSFRAPIFYDSDNTAYYLNPLGGFNFAGGTSNRVTFAGTDSGLQVTGAEGSTGEVRVGAAWGFPGIYTAGDLSLAAGATTNSIRFRLGSGEYAAINSDYLYHNSDIRTPIFYDTNDTGYYCDPNGIASLNDIRGMVYYIRDDTNSRWDNNIFVLRGGSPTIYFRDTDQNSAMLHNNGNLFYILRGGNDTETWATVGSGSWPMVVNLTNNDITFGGNISAVYNVTAYSSDRRLKENIKEIPNAIEKIKKIRGVTFDWNDAAEKAGFVPPVKYNDVGVIAQEVQEVLPQLVTLAPFDRWEPEPGSKHTNEELAEKMGTSKSGENYLTVQYDRIVPLLIQAIKEQQEQIDELKAMIEKS